MTSYRLVLSCIFASGLAWFLGVGCTVQTQPGQPAAFPCSVDNDCLADQICQQGTCRDHKNPIPPGSEFPQPQPDGSPPQDQPPLDQPKPPDFSGTCNPGVTAPCYSGPKDTQDRGACKAGVRTCNNSNTWGPCIGEIAPKEQEICNDGVDDDCDGEVDENCPPAGCKAGDARNCYTGPPNTQTKGTCKAGVQRCTGGAWGPCEGQVLPQPEKCDGKDNDCDGTIDEEGCGGCPSGATQVCYAGGVGCTLNPRGTLTCVGACKGGVQTCEGGKWGACKGSVTPAKEECNGKDDDCDGKADEDFTCATGQTRACGSGVGECKQGTQTCSSACQWSLCTGSTLPKPEVCDGKDNNCNGTIDDGFPCEAGEKRPCGSSTGACKTGSQTCSSSCQWSTTCVGEVKPVKEICDDKIDNDCNGKVDDGCSTSAVVLLSITPSTGTRGANYSGALKGAGFVAGSKVEVSSAQIPTPTYADISTFGGKVTFKSASELTLTLNPIPSSLAKGDYYIRILNPGNVRSNTVIFTLQNQSGGSTPTITSLTPTSAQAGKAYNGTIVGTGFDPGVAIELRAPVLGQFLPLNLLGSAVTITRVSATKITFSISNVPASFSGISLLGSHDLRVSNTNGKSSNTVKLTIKQ